MAMSRTHRPVTAFGALVPGTWVSGASSRSRAVADVADPRAWPAAEDTPNAGLRRMIGPVASLVGLAAAVVGVLAHATTSAHPAALIADAALLGAGYVLALYAGPRSGRATRIALIAVLIVLGAGFAVIVGDPHGLGVLAYPIIAAVVLLPVLWTRALGTAAALGALILSWRLTGIPNWDTVLLLGFVAYVLTGIRQLSRTIAELRRARDEIAELSVAAERARVARDLHDVLGHSLTTITVKTGLARRVLESGADPGRAVTEMRDAERLSRETLDEIRATVSGYRRASLPAELAGARSALRGAAITAHLPQAADDVREDLREPFAHVLREGVTNVIRHAGATTCEVTLTPTSIEIRNDTTATGAAASTPGTGLAGLAERMDAVGGRLSYGPLPGGGFRLRADAPPRTEDTA